MKFRGNLCGFSWDFLGMGGCYEYRIVYDVEGDLHRVIYRFIALAFDSSPIKGEGESGWFGVVGWIVCCQNQDLRDYG